LNVTLAVFKPFCLLSSMNMTRINYVVFQGMGGKVYVVSQLVYENERLLKVRLTYTGSHVGLYLSIKGMVHDGHVVAMHH